MGAAELGRELGNARGPRWSASSPHRPGSATACPASPPGCSQPPRQPPGAQPRDPERRPHGLARRVSGLPCLIIRLIIQTIRRDPAGSVWTDEAPNVSRPDPTGADQIDAEHQATDLAVEPGSGRWDVELDDQ